jgi:CheY-like chemotaxis protein
VTAIGQGYVLVVEDDDAIRVSLGDALAEDGLTVRSASNGHEGLELLTRCGPAMVVLLDLMMPVMDGEQFRRCLLADPLLAAIPVVLMTASHAHSFKHLQVAAVLRKPFPIDELMAKLQPFLVHRAS